MGFLGDIRGGRVQRGDGFDPGEAKGRENKGGREV